MIASATAIAEAPGRTRCGRRRAFAQQAGQCRQQHQGQDHGEILDDEPADRDAAAFAVEQVPLLERAQEHDGARHRQRQAEDETAADRPTHRPGQADPEERRQGDLRDGAGNGDRPDRKQVLEGEVQADAEHEQDDADLREFAGERLIGDEAGRVRPHRDAGQQIAGQGRQPQAIGDRPEDESQNQSGDDGGDERRVVRHASPGKFTAIAVDLVLIRNEEQKM